MGNAVIGALRVNLGMDSASFQRGAQRSETRLQSLQRRFRAAGQNIQRAGRRLSIGMTAPLLAFGRQAVQASRAQEEAVAQVEAGLASMGDAAGYNLQQLQDMASAMQNRSLYGDEDILRSVTANLLTFGNISGDVFERTQQAALDMSTRLGQDLQSSAVMLGKALNDPIAGLSALSRVGVQFTDDQREMIGEMVEAGNIAAAQGLILDELAKQYGGAAEAAASTDSGRITQAWNAIGDAMEAVGAIILPIVAEIADKVKEWAEAFQSLSPETQAMIVKALALAAALGPVLIAVGLAVSSFGKFLPIIAALLSPLGLLATAIAAVTIVIWRNWDAIKEWVAAAIQFGVDTIAGISEAFQNGVAVIREKIVDIWVAIREEVSTWPGRFYNFGVQIVQNMMDGINSRAQPLVDLLRRIGSPAGARAVATPSAPYQPSSEPLDLTPDVSDMDVLDDPHKRGFDQGKTYGEGISTGAREALGIHSPSRVMREIGQFIMQGMGIGITRGASQATGAMAEVTGDLEARVRDADLGGAIDGWEDAVSRLGETSDQVFSRFGGWLADLVTGATTLRQTLANAFSSSGNSAISTGRGILGGWLTDSFGDSVGGVLSGFVDGLFGAKNGADFVVPGMGGVDSQLLAMRVTPGERVRVTRPDQEAMAGGDVARVVIEEAAGFAARVRGISGGVAVETVQSYDHQMPGRVDQISNDPRVR